MNAYQMPFGKYKGCRLVDVPEDYLRWLVANVALRNPLRRYVLDRLRVGNDRPRGSTATTPGINFDALRRKFATKYHPDVAGGSKVAMAVVNDIFDHLGQLTTTQNSRAV